MRLPRLFTARVVHHRGAGGAPLAAAAGIDSVIDRPAAGLDQAAFHQLFYYGEAAVDMFVVPISAALIAGFSSAVADIGFIRIWRKIHR